MEVTNGKCAFCTENSNVLATKDRNKFLDLINMYYFEENKINGDKFFLLFKKKNSDNSICVSCAHKITCYVEMRKKFQLEACFKRKATCSICLSQTNLTSGTDQLKKDVLLMTTKKNAPRIVLICLNCCFAISSWNFIRNSIEKYLPKEDELSRETGNNGIKKRKYLVEKSMINVNNNIPYKRLRRMPSNRKNTPVNDDIIEEKRNNTKKTSLVKNNKKNTKEKLFAIENKDRFEHLTNVSKKMKSAKICLAPKVKSDKRMMFDIPYVLCKSNKYDSSPNITTRKRTRSRKSESHEIIEISDTELEDPKRTKQTAVGVRQSSRISKKQHSCVEPTKLKRKDNMNQCTSCPKKYKKKYRLKLHLLEHESSFSPQVIIEDKEENADSYKRLENIKNVEIDGESNVIINNKINEDKKQSDETNDKNKQKEIVESSDEEMEPLVHEEKNNDKEIESSNKEEKEEEKSSQTEKINIEPLIEEEGNKEDIECISEKNEQEKTLNNDETIAGKDEETDKEVESSDEENKKLSVRRKPKEGNCNNKENKSKKSSPRSKKKKVNSNVEKNKKENNLSKEEKQNTKSSEKQNKVEENMNSDNEDKEKDVEISSNEDVERKNDKDEKSDKKENSLSNDETEKMNHNNENKKDTDDEMEISSNVNVVNEACITNKNSVSNGETENTNFDSEEKEDDTNIEIKISLNEDNEIENTNHNKEKEDDADDIVEISLSEDNASNDAEEKCDEDENSEKCDENKQQEENNDNFIHRDTNENDKQNEKEDTNENKKDGEENEKTNIHEEMDSATVIQDESSNSCQEVAIVSENNDLKKTETITAHDDLETGIIELKSPEKLQNNGVLDNNVAKSSEDDEASKIKEKNSDSFSNSTEELEKQPLNISPDFSQQSQKKDVNLRDLPVETSKNEFSVDRFRLVENILENLGA